MGMRALNPVAYGELLAVELPKRAKNVRQFNRLVARLEALDFAKRKLTPEEEALREILVVLIADYDDTYSADAFPEPAPHEMVQHIMEQRGLKQADLVPVLGSRSQVSDLVNGKRGKKLAAYFRVSPELFI
jgi:HTH-type transcriptional regulator/antitoxin HigA